MTRCCAKTLKGSRCKKSTLSGSKLCWNHEEKNICGICLDESVKKSDTNVLLNCNHTFCKKCIYVWIMNKQSKDACCPNCRIHVGNDVIDSSEIWGEQTGILISIDVFYYSIEKSQLNFEERLLFHSVREVFNLYLIENDNFEKIDRMIMYDIRFSTMFQKIKDNAVNAFSPPESR
jgi:hypothetical protein